MRIHFRRCQKGAFLAAYLKMIHLPGVIDLGVDDAEAPDNEVRVGAGNAEQLDGEASMQLAVTHYQWKVAAALLDDCSMCIALPAVKQILA